eukprot:CAMPEP_0119489484 /NCGR_PEP_ID=MMETSP1344-20130328/14915_1 /TAXON_ID=236787 /ORGANISM="Florenciella parvula, Strain CCMP2471" /LENGTH=702 /DNA_ID=CAMNT_0007524539 /DNA_START=104 /DNA_END=2209 /DNA_ORIENTATION=+
MADLMEEGEEGYSDGSLTDDWDESCMVCSKPGHLLCCDGCVVAIHLGCVEPPLTEMPRGKWFCTGCTSIALNTASASGGGHTGGHGSTATDVWSSTCDVCSAGGDLLCCDGCPRAFHLRCLGLTAVPDGDFLCDECEGDACAACGGELRIDNHIICGSEKKGQQGCERLFHLDCVGLSVLPEGDWWCRDCRGHEHTGEGAAAYGVRTLRPRSQHNPNYSDALSAAVGERRSHNRRQHRSREAPPSPWDWMALDLEDDGSSVWSPCAVLSSTDDTVSVRYLAGELKGRYCELKHDDRHFCRYDDPRWIFSHLPSSAARHGAELYHRAPTARQRGKTSAAIQPSKKRRRQESQDERRKAWEDAAKSMVEDAERRLEELVQFATPAPLPERPPFRKLNLVSFSIKERQGYAEPEADTAFDVRFMKHPCLNVASTAASAATATPGEDAGTGTSVSSSWSSSSSFSGGLVFDGRLTGKHPDIQAIMKADPDFTHLLRHSVARAACMRTTDEFTISFSCLLGLVRSVAVAELVAAHFRELAPAPDSPVKVAVTHLELVTGERVALQTGPPSDSPSAPVDLEPDDEPIWMSWREAWVGVLCRRRWRQHYGTGIDTTKYYCSPDVQKENGKPSGVENVDYFVNEANLIRYAQRLVREEEQTALRSTEHPASHPAGDVDAGPEGGAAPTKRKAAAAAATGAGRLVARRSPP